LTRHEVRMARGTSGVRGRRRRGRGMGRTRHETGLMRPCETRGVGAHSARPEAQGHAARGGSVESVRMNVLTGVLPKTLRSVFFWNLGILNDLPENNLTRGR
jgi:hypothetical protein